MNVADGSARAEFIGTILIQLKLDIPNSGIWLGKLLTLLKLVISKVVLKMKLDATTSKQYIPNSGIWLGKLLTLLKLGTNETVDLISKVILKMKLDVTTSKQLIDKVVLEAKLDTEIAKASIVKKMKGKKFDAKEISQAILPSILKSPLVIFRVIVEMKPILIQILNRMSLDTTGMAKLLSTVIFGMNIESGEAGECKSLKIFHC
ncbi:unnamed protein product [Dicrocoelium dendriticum]|nr:unnamed protein product [Dicrocoelium dendriticum]